MSGYETQRKDPRMDLGATEVQLKFDDLAGLERQYAANISLGGMFVRSNRPKPVGTRLNFELALSNGATVIQGVGEVVWRHVQRTASEPPSGMGIRFDKLNGLGREIILNMMDEHLARGGQPFEIRTPTAPASASQIAVTPDAPAEGPDVTATADSPPEVAAPGQDPVPNEGETSAALLRESSRQLDLVRAQLARLKPASSRPAAKPASDPGGDPPTDG